MAVCAIGLDEGKLGALLASRQHDTFIPISNLEFPVNKNDLVEVIRSNIDILEEEIKLKEKKYSIEIEKIYSRLPLEWAKVKIVEDSIPLAIHKKKAITEKDIYNARKYIENVTLDWNEICLHNIVLEYSVDNERYFSLPHHLEGRRLGLKTLLIIMERKKFQEIYKLFDTIGRKFMGFVYTPLADISVNRGGSALTLPYVSVNIGEMYTVCSILVGNNIFYKIFEFGEIMLRRSIEDRFLLSEEISSNILSQYISFHDSFNEKELVLKNNTNYINLSIGSVNNYIKDITSKEITAIVDFLISQIEGTFRILFVGKVACVAGFYEFLRKGFPALEIELPCFYSDHAHLLGCIKYGSFRYLEKVEFPRKRWWDHLSSLYTKCKDYF